MLFFHVNLSIDSGNETPTLAVAPLIMMRPAAGVESRHGAIYPVSRDGDLIVNMRLMTFLLPPIIGLGASYAFAPLAAGMLPADRNVPGMVQAAEVPTVAVWDRIEEIEATAVVAQAGSDMENPDAVARARIAGMKVFQKPDASADDLTSRLLNIGQFTTRSERDGLRHALTVNLALEFVTHEAALSAYEPIALMRLRDVALSALVAAGKDDGVYRSGFSEAELSRALGAMIRAELPEVGEVHLMNMSLRDGPARTAMR
jgi:hypothetical protein